MKRLSFYGKTPTEALRNAQQECGEDAIVMSTKKVNNPNGGGNDVYEIVVMVEDDNTKINTTYTKKAIAKIQEEKETLKQEAYDFKEEMLKIQNILESVQQSIWNPKSKLYNLTIPPEFITMYDIFEKNEFDQEMTYTIMKKTIKQLPVFLKSNPQKINDFFKLILRRIIPIKHEIPLGPQQRKIMMMVGPTGVGKTTTISKLAARYAYKLGQNYKVGIITLDSFRVGAVEQLQAYTNIMRLQLEVVKKPEELIDALMRLKGCNYIFIDTAGSSQYDIDKIETINEFQKRIEEMPIEKILVLPANVKHSDLLEVYKNYSVLNIDYLIFTKLDETRSFGNLISFAHKSKKSIIYFSIGQNVPDDLIESDAGFLIECFINQSCARK